MPLQLELNDRKEVTLITNSSASQSPGEHWLRGDEQSLWISTEQVPAFNCVAIDMNGWTAKPSGAVVAEISNELNGNVFDLSNRFWKLMESKAPEYAKAIKNDTVVSLEYEDRYLKSPWTVVLLAGILKALNPVPEGSVTIRTLEGDSYRHGIRSWHDWNQPDDQRIVSSTFIRALLKVAQVTVDLRGEARDLAHRRVLVITLGSGQTIKCSFDQGMGYWELRTSRQSLKSFDFSLGHEPQINQLLELFKNVRMENIGGWSTNISLYEDRMKN